MPQRLQAVLSTLLILAIVRAGAVVEREAAGHDGWIERVEAAREAVGREADPLRASQAALFRLSLDFPVRTDWILQDLPGRAWQLLLPDQSAAAERTLGES